jgi:sporadic carbohydrate cluster protein (TIGR04323 family)
VQNLVVRNYSQTHELAFKLSLVEYAMPGCNMMLQTLLEEIASLDGIVVFSMFMLPRARHERERVYDRVLGGGAVLHAALESTAIRGAEEITRFEDTIAVAHALRGAPLHGRFAKDGQAFPPGDPFAAALRQALERTAAPI